MNDIARITCSGGKRPRPAQNGDDAELVFDEAEGCGRRHGQARRELGRSARLISVTSTEPAAACTRGDNVSERLHFALAECAFCRRCAQQSAR